MCFQLTPDRNPDFVFHEGSSGPPGQKGEKGDVGPPGDTLHLPASSDLLTKGKNAFTASFDICRGRGSCFLRGKIVRLPAKLLKKL